MNKVTFAMLAALALISCTNTTQNKETTVSKEIMENSNVKLCDVEFTKSLNIKDNTIQTAGDTVLMNAGEQTDLFCDPKGVATNTTAPLLATTVDNTKPFTFTVKVKPQFTPDGTYSAGAILAFVDKTHWQKLCFEQDEDGKHRIVTVRTIDTSDDNNHESVDSPSVYLRMSSDTQVIGNYYSEDGENWHLVRIYKNEYPSELTLSLSAQSPKDKSHTCKFSDVKLENRTVSDFRRGNM